MNKKWIVLLALLILVIYSILASIDTISISSPIHGKYNHNDTLNLNWTVEGSNLSSILYEYHRVDNISVNIIKGLSHLSKINHNNWMYNNKEVSIFPGAQNGAVEFESIFSKIVSESINLSFNSQTSLSVASAANSPMWIRYLNLSLYNYNTSSYDIVDSSVQLSNPGSGLTDMNVNYTTTNIDSKYKLNNRIKVKIYLDYYDTNTNAWHVAQGFYLRSSNLVDSKIDVTALPNTTIFNYIERVDSIYLFVNDTLGNSDSLLYRWSNLELVYNSTPERVFNNTDYYVNLTINSETRDYINTWIEFFVNDLPAGLFYYNLTNGTNAEVAKLLSGNFSGGDNISVEIAFDDLVIALSEDSVESFQPNITIEEPSLVTYSTIDSPSCIMEVPFNFTIQSNSSEIDICRVSIFLDGYGFLNLSNGGSIIAFKLHQIGTELIHMSLFPFSLDSIFKFTIFSIPTEPVSNEVEIFYELPNCEPDTIHTTSCGDFTLKLIINDTSGLQTNTSINFSTVYIPPSGGGGGTTTIKPANWTMETAVGVSTYEISIPSGTSSDKNIQFVNTGEVERTITLSCEDIKKDMCKYITFKEESFDLPLIKDEILRKTFTITLPKNTTKGEYQFNIIGTDQDGSTQFITATISTGGEQLLIETLSKIGLKTEGGFPYWIMFTLPFLFLLIASTKAIPKDTNFKFFLVIGISLGTPLILLYIF